MQGMKQYYKTKKYKFLAKNKHDKLTPSLFKVKLTGIKCY